jgi:hypothetical protein
VGNVGLENAPNLDAIQPALIWQGRAGPVSKCSGILVRHFARSADLCVSPISQCFPLKTRCLSLFDHCSLSFFHRCKLTFQSDQVGKLLTWYFVCEGSGEEFNLSPYLWTLIGLCIIGFGVFGAGWCMLQFSLFAHCSSCISLPGASSLVAHPPSVVSI